MAVRRVLRPAVRLRQQHVHVVARRAQRVCLQVTLTLPHGRKHARARLVARRHVRRERRQLGLRLGRDVLPCDRLEDGVACAGTRAPSEGRHRIRHKTRPRHVRHLLPVAERLPLQAEKSPLVGRARLQPRLYLARPVAPLSDSNSRFEMTHLRNATANDAYQNLSPFR